MGEDYEYAPAPYELHSEGTIFRTYVVTYNGDSIRYTNRLSEAKSLVFLLNTAFAEGSKGILLGDKILYPRNTG